jgi:DNA-binding transcriptional MerR regulator
MKNSRELTAYLARIAESAEWGEPGSDGAAVAVPRKLYRVSEIAAHMGLTRQTLHNYATIGLITEERRTDGGQRLFDESVFGRLAVIQRLKRTHRLHEIRRMLDVDEFPQPAATARAAEAGGRSMLERSQDIAAIAHLTDDLPQMHISPALGPREREAAPGPDVAAGAPHEASPPDCRKENAADEQT